MSGIFWRVCFYSSRVILDCTFGCSFLVGLFRWISFSLFGFCQPSHGGNVCVGLRSISLSWETLCSIEQVFRFCFAGFLDDVDVSNFNCLVVVQSFWVQFSFIKSAKVEQGLWFTLSDTSHASLSYVAMVTTVVFTRHVFSCLDYRRRVSCLLCSGMTLLRAVWLR